MTSSVTCWPGECVMRLVAALVCAGLLTACSQATAPAVEAPTFPETGEQAVQLGVNDDLPQWLLIARQASGGAIFWDRNSIVRNAEGQASIWARVEFDTNQVREAEDATTLQLVTYRVTEVNYLFNCADSTFVITEQRFMGENNAIAGSVQFDAEAPRAAVPGTTGALLLPIACQAR